MRSPAGSMGTEGTTKPTAVDERAEGGIPVLKSPFDNLVARVLRGGHVVKFRGQVASAAPTLGLGLASCVVGAGLSALIGLGSTTSALAACDLKAGGQPNEIFCEGTKTTQQDITVKDAQITTSADFSVDTSNDPTKHGISIDAISTKAGGGITFTSTTSKEIKGGNAALNAVVRSGDGDLTIKTGTGAVTGGDHGIFADHLGTGAVTIETNGDITGQRKDGIFSAISNKDNQKDLTITTGKGKVTSARDGIVALHIGKGTATIKTATGAVTGGQSGIRAIHYGTGALTIETNGDITGTSNNGIYALIDNVDNNNALKITTGKGKVKGGKFGIYAWHDGLGTVTIQTGDGAVSGGQKDGIRGFIGNQQNDSALTITTGTGAVTGGRHGISAEHGGTGAVTIETGDGDVTGTNANGIFAHIANVNNNKALKITTGDGIVTGGQYGILAELRGAGALTIETNGDITGQRKDGIFSAISNKDNQKDLTITTGTGAVTGALNGIVAEHSGKGAVTINTGGGAVTGQGSHYGIRVYVTNLQNDSALTITTGTGAVEGGLDGIFAKHRGTGALTIETNGNVTGRTLDGINALIDNANNNNALTITIGTGAVTGGQHGIFADHQGRGAVTIKTGDGNVTGKGRNGIVGIMRDFGSTNDLTITTGKGAVKGDQYGILAELRGTGALTIETNGDITGTNVDGINASIFSANNNNALKITTGKGNVIGETNGIFAHHQGQGKAVIAVNGLVQGRTRYGIDSLGLNGMTEITLNNNADVRGARGKAAIINGDGNSQLKVNEGAQITGDVTLGKGKDEVIFLGGFDFSGVNGEFDGGDGDQDGIVFRNRTKTAAAVNADQFEGFERATIDGGSTEFTGQTLNLGGATGLLSLINDGTLVVGTQLNNINGSVHNNVGSTIDMQDSQFSTLTITGDYTGGGTIRMDTVLGDSKSETDRIIITGSTSGTTNVYVVNRSGKGADKAKIQLIEVRGTSGGKFMLTGGFTNPNIGGGNEQFVTAGVYAYRLQKDGKDWFLNSEMAPTPPTPTTPGASGKQPGQGGGGGQQPGQSGTGSGGGGKQPGTGTGGGGKQPGQGGGGGKQPGTGTGGGPSGGNQPGTSGNQPGRSGGPSGGNQPGASGNQPGTSGNQPGRSGGPRIYSPGAVAYENLAHTALELNRMESLHARFGGRVTRMALNGSQSTLTLGAASQDAGLLHEGEGGAKANPDRWLTSWARMSGRLSHQTPRSSTTGVTERDTQVFKLQGGVDAEFVYDNDNTAVFGLNASLSHGRTDFSSVFGNGEIKTTGIGIGLSATWYGPQGFYADVQGAHTWYSSDLTSDLVGKLADDVDGTGYGLSAEVGKAMAMANGLTLTPQAQLAYSKVSYDDFTSRTGVVVSGSEGTSVLARLGIAASHERTWQDNGGGQALHVEGIMNLYHEFEDGVRVDVAGTRLTSGQHRWTGELGGRFTRAFNDDAYALYGELSVSTDLEDFGDSYALKGSLGLAVRW